MEERFTPGPWHVADRQLMSWCIEGPKCEDLAFFNESNGADEPEMYPALANATLAASAPDLYAALEAMLDHSGVTDVDTADKFDSDIEAESMARAALSRARGEG